MIRFVSAAVLSLGIAFAALAQDEPPFVIAETITDRNVRDLLAIAEATDMEAQPTAALEAWQAAYEAALATAPDDQLALAQIGNQLGAAYFYAGQDAEALGYFRSAASAFEAAGPDYAENWQEALGNVGSILTGLGQFSEAEAVQLQAFEIRQTLYPEDHPQIARSYFELGSLANQQGRSDEAASLVRQSLEIRLRVLGENHPHVAMTEVSLASILSTAQRHDESISMARRGLERLEQVLPPEHPFIGFAKSNYAGALNAAGRHREAEPFLRQIVEERRLSLGDTHPNVADSLNNLAVAVGAQNRPEEARTLFLAAYEIYVAAEGPDSPTAARIRANAADFAGDDVLTERRLALADFDRIGIDGGEDRLRLVSRLAVTLAEAGEQEAALAHISDARALAADLFPESHEVSLALIIDEAWIRAADPAAGRAALDLAESAARTLIQRSPLNVDASRDAGVRRDRAIRRALDVAYAAGDTDLILALLDAGGSSGLALAANAASARSGEAADLIRSRQDAARRTRAAEQRYVSLRTAGASPERVSEAAGVWEEARAQLSNADADLPTNLQIAPDAATLDSVQAGLAPGEAVLAFAFTERGGVTAAISSEDIRIDRMTIAESDALTRVARIRESLTVGAGAFRSAPQNSAASLTAFPAADAHALYEGLFTQEIREVTDTARLLSIVPDGAYVSLPFSVLITEAGPTSLEAQEALRQAAWLVRNHAVRQVPSLLPNREAAFTTRTRQTRLVAAGAPAFTGQSGEADLATLMRGGQVDPDAISDLPALPGARRELDRLADRFGAQHSTLITGVDATETAVLNADLENADILVFATHGLLPGEFEGLDEPALAFLPPSNGSDTADGLLTASEIANLRLSAEWVVLSACNTFTDGRSTPPDRLAEAFLYAGARSLLVSHWAVRDDVAATITLRVTENTPALGRAEAHRQALLSVLEDRTVRGGAHPGVWGPFALIGR